MEICHGTKYQMSDKQTDPGYILMLYKYGQQVITCIM